MQRDDESFFGGRVSATASLAIKKGSHQPYSRARPGSPLMSEMSQRGPGFREEFTSMVTTRPSTTPGTLRDSSSSSRATATPPRIAWTEAPRRSAGRSLSSRMKAAASPG